MDEINNLKHKWARVAITAVIFLFFAIMFLPFVTPMLMAALFAFALDPIVSRFSVRKSKRRWPIILILMGFFVAITLPIGIVASRVVKKVSEYSALGWQNTSLYQTAEGLYSKGLELAESMGLHITPDQLTPPSSLIASAGSWLVGFTTSLASRAPEFILGLFVFSGALFFFLTQSRDIRKGIEKLDLLSVAEFKQIIRIVQNTAYITLISTALIGTIQALIVAFGAWLSGFTEVLLVLIISLVMSFIPVIGVAPVAVVMSLICFFQQDVKGGIIMLVIAGIAGTIDNILKPIILKGGDEDLDPIISLLAIIGSVIVYGFPGLLLGPILTRLAFKIIPILFAPPLEDSEDDKLEGNRP